MWQIAIMAYGAYQGIQEGDAIMDQADQEAKELEEEGLRIKTNSYREGRDTYVNEQIESGNDLAKSANNITTGMSETSHTNQMLAANLQASLRESQALLEEGDRMEALYRKRAETTRKVGSERASKAVVNGIMGGAVSAYSAGK